LASEELSRLFDLIEEYNSVNSKGKLNLSNIKRLQTKLNLDKEVMDKLADFIKRRPNILCADLIPWHSNKASDIHNYIATHKKQILLKVLVPLIEMANNIKNISLKNKIFVRGVTFRNIVNNILKNNKERVTEIKHYIVFKEGGVIDEFNSLITTFNSIHTNKKSKQEIKTKWYIFTAGQSMFLPDLNYKYVVECFDNTGERKNLRTFLLEYNP